MRRLRTLAAAFGMLLASLAPALAVAPDEVLKDPVLEARARDLSAHLRCMVCQNQSIDDSDAPLAKDLRILVRERLVAGDSDEEVVDYLVSRYGEFVLLKPRFAWHTAILWFAPLVALLGGLAGLFLAIRKRSTRSGDAVREVPLTEEEEARLIELLDKGKS
ncbi:cytochrome c-type biogenesis protein [Roseibium litorale]|uniref:Cytochrome c-type biogenesis protein n=1 Tax=Roseibium litorale TaxID=2803841 RepID=A0ABR9CS09_9HYPH|nr:cytochrome c-type biogenesis protein [Roseibium litorale]MBD8893473.1 cytochrome c-type biogenesis protein CcmH [Roseibium litorale]